MYLNKITTAICRAHCVILALFVLPLLRHFSFSFHVYYREPWSQAFILWALFLSLQSKAVPGSAPQTIPVLLCRLLY